MKKIIAALDGLKFSESTLQYTVYLAKIMEAHVVGVFLDDMTYHSYKVSELFVEEGGISNELRQEFNDVDREKRNLSVHLFEAACVQGGVQFSIHRDRNVALQELLHESIFSDLLIIDSKETFTRVEEAAPTSFVRNLLSDVHCPVLIVPQHFKPFQKIVLLYDGEPASIYAVKAFNYTLSNLKTLPAELVSVRADEEKNAIPDNRLMKEFIKRHFDSVEFVVLKGGAEGAILSYLQHRAEDSLVILGAYRRSLVSRWFRHSMADALLARLPVPLFIAPNK